MFREMQEVDFWSNARSGRSAGLQQYCEVGFVSPSEVRAPLASYHHVREPYHTAGFVLIQHGSYQWIGADDQPDIRRVARLKVAPEVE
jgi:hypothetical protein